ncbi:MAG: alpha/beta fold hydrolase [Burkholderiales bacterium]|nr:MAG: alpha/beta fold hydrolase [Burkholderiales bacterium]
MSGVAEKVVLLGAGKTVVSIVTQPVRSADDGRPAVVVLNTGIIHRIGHNRMYVTLARELAELGHVVLRLDQSGLGDSAPRPDVVDPLHAGLADISDAIDWLVAKGSKSVVLLGLCSGADFTIAYAGRDPRVVGAVLMDPSIPPTTRYRLNAIGARLMRGEAWTNLFRGRGRVWKIVTRQNAKPTTGEWAPSQLSFDDPQVRAFFEKAYGDAVDAGNQILAIFTGGLKYQHNYKRQLLDAMPNVRFGKQLHLEYFASCDHTFTFLEDRRRMFDKVKAWLSTTEFRVPDAQVLAERALKPTS